MTVAELPSHRFRPLVYGVGAWTDNLYFAYDLVATLRPRLLVELGTDRGESYFAFCQSVAENGTATRCFAIDTWRGDEQAGGYDETTWAEVSAHNAQHYAAFSSLLRCTFDDALGQFAPETIDLLHLDGLHTEKAVRHDLDAWLPKIQPGGILLMHDISVRGREFGVWKVWDELRERSRAYAFSDGPGLGVWQKPPAMPLAEPLATLFDAPTDAAAALAAYYRQRARETQEQIGQHWR
ncbi:MAG TPA: class I SAM-dependent methyltransferase, partial [Chthoniobacterales bacterium]|nr:class I SAM-dependent methyltransferase [Chthoniobacterales bacterium]